jgi:hypothetical protein
MPTFLEELRASLGDSSSDVLVVFMPRFALEVAHSRYGRNYYELPKISDSGIRDDIEALLDLGNAGMSDYVLASDIVLKLGEMVEQMVVSNGHLEQVQQALYTSDDVAIADVVAESQSDSGSWTADDIASLLDVLGIIGAAL